MVRQVDRKAKTGHSRTRRNSCLPEDRVPWSLWRCFRACTQASYWPPPLLPGWGEMSVSPPSFREPPIVLGPTLDVWLCPAPSLQALGGAWGHGSCVPGGPGETATASPSQAGHPGDPAAGSLARLRPSLCSRGLNHGSEMSFYTGFYVEIMPALWSTKALCLPPRVAQASSPGQGPVLGPPAGDGRP